MAGTGPVQKFCFQSPITLFVYVRPLKWVNKFKFLLLLKYWNSMLNLKSFGSNVAVMLVRLESFRIVEMYFEQYPLLANIHL